MHIYKALCYVHDTTPGAEDKPLNRTNIMLSIKEKFYTPVEYYDHNLRF